VTRRTEREDDGRVRAVVHPRLELPRGEPAGLAGGDAPINAAVVVETGEFRVRDAVEPL